MADHPEGFIGGRALKEADIGSDLWSAAEVPHLPPRPVLFRKCSVADGFHIAPRQYVVDRKVAAVSNADLTS